MTSRTPEPCTPRTQPAAWTYVSGRVAALEGSLLTADALEQLAGAQSPAAVASALADSPLRSAAAESRTPAEAAEAVGAHYAGLLQGIRADCPAEAMFELLSLPAEYRGLKDRVRAASAGAATTEPGPGPLAELLEAAWDGQARAGLELLAAALSGDRRPEPALAADLVLDSARLLEALALAGALSSEPLRAHVAAEVRVRSMLVVWRSKLLAEQELQGSALGEWLPRLFLRGELGRDLAGSLWAAAFSAWPSLVAGALSEALAGESFGGGEPQRLTGWERAAFNWLTARARQFRTAAFGVERVYGYAWGLAVEERNVRLALVGRLRGVAPEAIRELLWEPYGG